MIRPGGFLWGYQEDAVSTQKRLLQVMSGQMHFFSGAGLKIVSMRFSHEAGE